METLLPLALSLDLLAVTSILHHYDGGPVLLGSTWQLSVGFLQLCVSFERLRVSTRRCNVQKDFLQVIDKTLFFVYDP